ncbi:hypothetical protein ACLB2K_026038 [Fragaria x ananassa]
MSLREEDGELKELEVKHELEVALVHDGMEAISNLNKPTPPIGFTENYSATYLSSGNPCLHLFFHVVPDTLSSYLHQKLLLAWAHDALTTLKLICNLRSVRGTGKSDKEGFYTAALWLHSHHPKTLACNVTSLAEFGYFKDLSEFLYRLLQGPGIQKNQKSEWEQRKHSIARRLSLRSAKSARNGLGVNRQEPKEVKRAKAEREKWEAMTG